MASLALEEPTKVQLLAFCQEARQPELVPTYLRYLEIRDNFQPVVFPKERKIYQSSAVLIAKLENSGQLWHETEIIIGVDPDAVNEKTKKIYICPFTGKVFGDNTHPNPQDAIYDWVSTCPENKERVGGLRTKRFHVSEDREVIASYIAKQPRQVAVRKVVFSSAISGKLFSSRQAVIDDFLQFHIKPMSLIEVQGQNRFAIDEALVEFFQQQVQEEAIAAFVESLAQYPEFSAFVERWIEES